jgi:hypothetical protein
MVKSEITPGKEYAFREKRGPRVPLQRVKVIEHIRGNKWKAEWVEPNPGLVDYVESAQLVVLWKDAKRLLKEEENAERLRRHNEEHGYAKGSPVVDAMHEVFESTGEGLHIHNGALIGSPEAIDRLRSRAGLTVSTPSLASYVDRDGQFHLAFDEALELARAFCAKEPSTVLVGIEATEQKWSQEATRPGDSYMVGLLNDYRAAWALIRQWAGHDAAVAVREERIKRLERLVWDAVYALQKAGLDSEAARLRRAVESS